MAHNPCPQRSATSASVTTSTNSNVTDTHTVKKTAHIPGPIPTTPGSKALTLVSVVCSGETHTGLWLLPGPSPPYTPFNMILPEPVACCDQMDMTVDQYPTFTSCNCNWTSIFAIIKQPALLWRVWWPESLGNYQNIKHLWQAWDEGAFVERVGHRPPLQLVDKEWGLQKHQLMLKGHLPSWQPHQKASVSVCTQQAVCTCSDPLPRCDRHGHSSSSSSNMLNKPLPMATWLLSCFKASSWSIAAS